MGNAIRVGGLANASVSTQASLGFSVAKAAANLPATTSANLFTITGGRILLTAIVGQVTTVIQTQANNLNLAFDPTVAGSNVNLCAVLNISAHAVGTLYSITGVPTDAMLSGLAVMSMTTPVILQPGAIVATTSATNTGQVSWKMWYMPLDAVLTTVAAA
jgi:hypothetical protein